MINNFKNKQYMNQFLLAASHCPGRLTEGDLKSILPKNVYSGYPHKYLRSEHSFGEFSTAIKGGKHQQDGKPLSIK